MKNYYLYLYLVDDKVVYVGQTCDPWGRYKQHLGEKENKQKYSEVNKVMLYGFDSRADVDIYETYYIATLKPELNKSKANFETPSIKLEDLCFEEHSLLSLEKYFKINSKHKGTYKVRKEIEKSYIFSNTQAMLLHNQHAKNDLEVRLENEIDNLKNQIEEKEVYYNTLKEKEEKIQDVLAEKNNELANLNETKNLYITIRDSAYKRFVYYSEKEKESYTKHLELVENIRILEERYKKLEYDIKFADEKYEELSRVEKRLKEGHEREEQMNQIFNDWLSMVEKQKVRYNELSKNITTIINNIEKLENEYKTIKQNVKSARQEYDTLLAKTKPNIFQRFILGFNQ